MLAEDVWVWLSFLLFLLLMGARAWAVETSTARPGRSSQSVRVLTAGCVLAFAGLVGLVWANGGAELVELLTGGES
jgi:hypothetical protein